MERNDFLLEMTHAKVIGFAYANAGRVTAALFSW
jgi:hypothetical protein